MPVMSKIFRGVEYTDLKPGQCTLITPKEIAPYIKRCPSPVIKGLETCARHTKSVSYRTTEGAERTQYFNTIEAAEEFRTKHVPLTWTEVNYNIRKGGYTK